VSAVFDVIDGQRDNAFLYVPLFFALGIAFYFGQYREPSLILFSIVSMGLLIGYGASLKWNNGVTYIVRPSLLALFLIAFGFTWAAKDTFLNGTIMLTKKDVAEIEGTLTSMSFIKDDLSKVILSDVVIEDKKDFETPQNVKLRSYHFTRDIEIGSRVKILASLMPPSRPVMPYAFDFQRHSYFQNIGATGYSLGEVTILSPPEKDFSLSRFFEVLRSHINQRIEGVLQPRNAALVKALVTGDRGGITDKDYESLRVAGLAHLLAISGLHIGLVSGFVFFFLRFALCLFPYLALHYPIKKIAAFVAFWSALFYMMLAGATIPTQRAALMSCLVFTAIMLDRRALSLRLVALAAFIVLLIEPYNLLTPSFQLSFAAVIALVSFYEWSIRSRREKQLAFMREGRDAAAPSLLFEQWRRKIWAKPFIYISGIMMTSLIAGMATSLFAIYHFGHYHPFGLLGNVLALPVVSLLIMPFAVAALILWPFTFISGAAFKIMGYGLDWVMLVADGIKSFPYSAASLAQMSLTSFALLILAFLALTILRGRARIALSFFIVICVFVLSLLENEKLVGVVHEDASSITLYEDHAISVYGSTVPSKFVREQIQEFYGISLHGEMEGQEARSKQYCDQSYCLLDVGGENIALIFDMTLYHKFCTRQDIKILIASDAVYSDNECRRDDLIALNFFDFWRYGSYAIFRNSDSGSLRVKSVEGARGLRPWTTRSQRRVIKNKKKQLKDE
jgi:competence protein ComEC